ncbi:MAG: glycoside hydrolase family 15 protein [Chloroflexi bacterium]|nr:glycoside hydrolase family 15 protein [Chloroflexota bacterium]
MPRDLPIGNGNLLLNFDQTYTLRDLYFPYVGQENHTQGNLCRFGVWVEGRFSWLSDPEWERDLRYEPDTLVTRVTCQHPGLGVRLECHDLVDFDRNLYIKQIDVTNLAPREREIRLFFHFDAHLWGTTVGDTAYFEPSNKALIFYKGTRYFWLSAALDDTYGPSSYATGDKGKPGMEGSWRDAEDGELSGNPIAQGSVDGVAGLHVRVGPAASRRCFFWLAAGTTYWEVRSLWLLVRDRGLESFVTRTRNFWRLWCHKEATDFGDLPQDLVDLYRHSLLIIRTQIDNRGAIIAANDTDIMQFGRDTYSYMWPRDGALVAWALTAAGYGDVTRAFFQFCATALHQDGYLLHKYNPDGSTGSSWHSWSSPEETLQLPIQEDETALVLWSLWAHYQRFRDLELIKPLYRRLIKTAADFLVRYREPYGGTGLPGPCYDLWEERWGIMAFTVAAVWAGLRAAARFTALFGEDDVADRYRTAAHEIKAAFLETYFDPERGRLARMVTVAPDGTVHRDPTLDVSLCGLFAFGMLAPDHPWLVATLEQLEQALWCQTPVGGVARYQHDTYQRAADGPGVPGNPWFICTLWLADWYLARARTFQDLERPLALLRWTAQHALPSGVLAEQVHPYTGAPLSVSPLTWSHAAYVTTVHHYLEARDRLAGRLPPVQDEDEGEQ